ncbi:MAG: hypothetical protein IKS28_06190 [Clostridia bacterium]|nr:hypothetical protein [Clostridia bacterium]
MEKETLTPNAAASKCVAAGADFPVGTRVEISRDGRTLYLVTPEKTRRAVTHEFIRSAEVLAMGAVKSGEDAFTVKYRLELTDGTSAILTVPAADAELVEHVLF